MKLVEVHRQDQASLFAEVDNDDFALVDEYRWYPLVSGNNVYARADVWKNGIRSVVLMHGVITGWSLVDHTDHNGLNNCRRNLRQSSPMLNQANRLPRKGRNTKYKGVRLKGTRWQARITIGGVETHLGYFPDDVTAAAAYDVAARQVWGEHALLNLANGDA